MDQITPKSEPSAEARDRPRLPGQVVLVFQGGGALGAYQGGVYQALHEAGIEPDWVVGTSIGALNGALIVGNDVASRLERLREFWRRVEQKPLWGETPFGQTLGRSAAYMMSLFNGVAGYYAPNQALAWGGLNALVGVERAAFYTIDGMRSTVGNLVDFNRLNGKHPRLTVGAVNVRSGKMHYFDSRSMPITLHHILASGALPPGFPAVRIDGDPYWDGGLYSNTPIEVVFDDNPRRNSVVFSVQIFPIAGPEPEIDHAGAEPPNRHSICEPRRQPYSATGTHSPASPHGARAGPDDAGESAQLARGQGDGGLWVRDAHAHRAHQRQPGTQRRLVA